MTVLFADDHQICRESVSGFLEQESFCRQVVQASTVSEAVTKVADEKPDLIVTDLAFPEDTGRTLMGWVREHHAEIPVVCMTMHADVSLLREVFALGARGFVTKSSGYEELLQAVRAVSAGRIYLDQVMLSRMLDYLDRGEAGDGGGALGELAGRERDIFFLLIQSHSIDEVAGELFISPKTVENHRSSIYRKLRVGDRLELMRFARDHGFLE